VIVATITLHVRWLRQRSTTLATNQRKGVDQRQQLRVVITVGTGQQQRERDALRFGNRVILRAGPSATGGTGSCFDLIP
jgi:hypothetical protein